jgi:hypothetical protein
VLVLVLVLLGWVLALLLVLVVLPERVSSNPGGSSTCVGAGTSMVGRLVQASGFIPNPTPPGVGAKSSMGGTLSSIAAQSLLRKKLIIANHLQCLDAICSVNR